MCLIVLYRWHSLYRPQAFQDPLMVCTLLCMLACSCCPVPNAGPQEDKELRLTPRLSTVCPYTNTQQPTDQTEDNTQSQAFTARPTDRKHSRRPMLRLALRVGARRRLWLSTAYPHVQHARTQLPRSSTALRRATDLRDMSAPVSASASYMQQLPLHPLGTRRRHHHLRRRCMLGQRETQRTGCHWRLLPPRQRSQPRAASQNPQPDQPACGVKGCARSLGACEAGARAKSRGQNATTSPPSRWTLSSTQPRGHSRRLSVPCQWDDRLDLRLAG